MSFKLPMIAISAISAIKNESSFHGALDSSNSPAAEVTMYKERVHAATTSPW